MRYDGKTFVGESVALDGHQYHQCIFRNCRVNFSAISPVTLDHCKFYGCSWEFSGPAALTVHFMSGIYNGIGGDATQLIEKTFDGIRSGTGLSAGEPSQVSFKPTIFIGHGHSQDYVALSNFLRGRGFEVETFESAPRAGKTSKEVVEGMARRASIAFLVHTAEDEQQGGEVRARQNVVHETGLFQGRLGFDRAIVVREAGCDPFTNLDGVQEIRYASGRLTDKHLDILDVIDREFPQPG